MMKLNEFLHSVFIFIQKKKSPIFRKRTEETIGVDRNSIFKKFTKDLENAASFNYLRKSRTSGEWKRESMKIKDPNFLRKSTLKKGE